LPNSRRNSLISTALLPPVKMFFEKLVPHRAINHKVKQGHKKAQSNSSKNPLYSSLQNLGTLCLHCESSAIFLTTRDICDIKKMPGQSRTLRGLLYRLELGNNAQKLDR